jgi:hypothetical protein
MGHKRNARRKDATRKTTNRWADNIKIDLREMGRGGVDWIDLTQNRNKWKAIVNMVINLRVSLHFGKFLSSCTTGGLWIGTVLREVCQEESCMFCSSRNNNKAVMISVGGLAFSVQLNRYLNELYFFLSVSKTSTWKNKTEMEIVWNIFGIIFAYRMWY